MRTDKQFYFSDRASLLAAYRDTAKRADPAFTGLFGRLPRTPYGVKAVPPDAEESQTTAYYMPGSSIVGPPGWFYANSLVVDTGVHATGWSRQRAIDYFSAKSAKSLHDITVEIDRYLASPGQALPCKIGELNENPKGRPLKLREVKFQWWQVVRHKNINVVETESKRLPNLVLDGFVHPSVRHGGVWRPLHHPTSEFNDPSELRFGTLWDGWGRLGRFF